MVFGLICSLEQIQFNCFVEHLCGGSNINLLQYSMVLFCPENLGGNMNQNYVEHSLKVIAGVK